jgi:inward rectifier potassium channel
VGSEHRRSLKIVGFRALKRGTPSAFSDLYYSAMELSWPAFIAAACLVFIAINIVFGAVYALLPGAILNAKPGSFLDSFFFSVETLATVGYGDMAPATYTAHTITTVEIMCGLLLLATVTGLTFARFSRPRQSILFSNVAIIGEYEGHEALIVRIASPRSQPIAEVTAQMALVERVEGKNGHVSRRVTDLRLVHSAYAMLTMTWTIAHSLDPDGALQSALREGRDVRILVTVSGLDTMLAAPTFGGRFYLRKEIVLDQDFVDMIVEVEDGSFEVDLSKLHLTRPRAT